MQYGPPMQSSADEAEYYFQELRAQRMRASQLFYGYSGDDGSLDEMDDDYFRLYQESGR